MEVERRQGQLLSRLPRKSTEHQRKRALPLRGALLFALTAGSVPCYPETERSLPMDEGAAWPLPGERRFFHERTPIDRLGAGRPPLPPGWRRAAVPLPGGGGGVCDGERGLPPLRPLRSRDPGARPRPGGGLASPHPLAGELGPRHGPGGPQRQQRAGHPGAILSGGERNFAGVFAYEEDGDGYLLRSACLRDHRGSPCPSAAAPPSAAPTGTACIPPGSFW